MMDKLAAHGHQPNSASRRKLVAHVTGDGEISEKREYVFTEWDPSATNDLEALRSVFDTNGDGKLTAADSTFGSFEVMVTNPNFTTEAKSLAKLGIAKIDLLGDATRIDWEVSRIRPTRSDLRVRIAVETPNH